MAKKKKQPPAGAPDWMVTYGDMVTLLLTFFVLLLTFMEVKQPRNVIEILSAVQSAFGYDGAALDLPLEDVELPKNIELMEMLMIPVEPENFSPTTVEGAIGRKDTVESIREGEFYPVGGKFLFEPLSAELNAEERGKIEKYAEEVRGYQFQLIVRGHCSALPVGDSPFRNHLDLSIARAMTIAEAFLAVGVDERRIRLEGAGTTRPANTQAYSDGERQINDVVEVLQVDITIDEFE